MATSTGFAPGVRTHFKTPEGRYNLSRDKVHPSAIPRYSLAAKVFSQVSSPLFITPYFFPFLMRFRCCLFWLQSLFGSLWLLVCVFNLDISSITLVLWVCFVC